MSEIKTIPNQAENPLQKKEQVRIFHRLQSLIKTISGKPNLVVTDEMEPDMQIQHLLEGKDPNNSWFRFQTRHPKTKKVMKEYVYVPKIVTERKEEVALGKAAHEAGHVIISHLHQIIPEDYFKTKGFGELLASAEERPTDNVVRVRYPGAGDWVDTARKDSILDGEIQRMQIQKQIGVVPSFPSFCTLVVYDRYYTENERLSHSPDVIEVMERARPVIEKIESTIPPVGASEQAAIHFSKKRAKIVHDELLPLTRPLLEKDLEIERLRQMLQEMMSKGDDSDVMEGLNEEEKKEIAKAMQRAIAEQKAEQLRNALKQDEGLSTEELEKELAKVDGALEELKQKIEEGSDDKSAQELLDRVKEQISDQDQMPIPISDLPSELKEKLEEMFEELAEEDQKRMNQLAEKMIEQIMEIVTSSLLMGTGSGRPIEVSQEELEEIFGEELPEEDAEPANKEVKESPEQVKNKKEKSKKLLEKRKELEEKFKDAEKKELPSKTAAYDKAYHEVMPVIDKLFTELEEVFYPQIRGGTVLKSEGSSINLQAVFKMISQKAGGARDVDYKIFENIAHPELKDYDITLLVDLSGSMASDGKIEEAFKSVIILSEVLNRLGVRFEVLGFQDVLIPYKNFDDEFDDRARNKMMIMPMELDHDYDPYGRLYKKKWGLKTENTIRGFNNNPNYNDDGPCLREASERLDRQHGSRKVLIVISDGQPSGRRSDERDLVEAVEHIKRNTDQRLLALGLGGGTGFVKSYYPTAIPNIKAHDLPEVLGGVLEALLINPDAVFSGEIDKMTEEGRSDDDDY